MIILINFMVTFLLSLSPQTSINKGFVVLRDPLRECAESEREEKIGLLSDLLEELIVRESNKKKCLIISIDMPTRSVTNPDDRIHKKILYSCMKYENLHILEVQFSEENKEQGYIKGQLGESSERYTCFTKCTYSLLKDPQGKNIVENLVREFNIEKIFIWGYSIHSCVKKTLVSLIRKDWNRPIYLSLLLSTGYIDTFRISIFEDKYEEWLNFGKVFFIDGNLFEKVISSERMKKKNAVKVFSSEMQSLINDEIYSFKKRVYQRGEYPSFVDPLIHSVLELKSWEKIRELRGNKVFDKNFQKKGVVVSVNRKVVVTEVQNSIHLNRSV